MLVEVGKLFGPHFFVVMKTKVQHGRDAGGVDPMNVARVERAIEDMGFDVVLMERRVGKSRALLKVRIEHRGDLSQERAVTVSDCATVTRVLREMLEEEGWVLEVSSPGVDRPLVKADDFDRFAGAQVLVKGYEKLANRGKKLEGKLLGLVGGEPQSFALDIKGDRVEIPLKAVALARLYPW